MPQSKDRKTYQDAIAALVGDRPIAYHPALAHLAGGVKCAVMLSQLLYWAGDKTVIERDGWVYKSIADLEQETGLTRLEQLTARTHLEERGLIHVRLKGVPRCWSYQVDRQAVANLFMIDDNAGTADAGPGDGKGDAAPPPETENSIEAVSHSMGFPLNGNATQHCAGNLSNVEAVSSSTLNGFPLQLKCTKDYLRDDRNQRLQAVEAAAQTAADAAPAAADSWYEANLVCLQLGGIMGKVADELADLPNMTPWRIVAHVRHARAQGDKLNLVVHRLRCGDHIPMKIPNNHHNRELIDTGQICPDCGYAPPWNRDNCDHPAFVYCPVCHQRRDLPDQCKCPEPEPEGEEA